MKVTLTDSIREPKKTKEDKELEAAEKKVQELKQAQETKKDKAEKKVQELKQAQEAKKAEAAKQTRDIKQTEEKAQTEYVEGVAGETIEVDDEMGRDLIKRGSATKATEEKPEEKPPE